MKSVQNKAVRFPVVLVAAAAVFTSLLLSGCGSGAGGAGMEPVGGVAATRDAPAQLFGRWKLVRSVGVYPSVQVYETTDTTNAEILVLNADGTFSRGKKDQSVTGTYQVTRRQTHTGLGERPVITYSNTTQEEIIVEASGGQLSLIIDAGDGPSLEYERITQPLDTTNLNR